jgi:hypothetical protein
MGLLGPFARNVIYPSDPTVSQRGSIAAAAAGGRAAGARGWTERPAAGRQRPYAGMGAYGHGRPGPTRVSMAWRARGGGRRHGAPRDVRESRPRRGWLRVHPPRTVRGMRPWGWIGSPTSSSRRGVTPRARKVSDRV